MTSNDPDELMSHNWLSTRHRHHIGLHFLPCTVLTTQDITVRKNSHVSTPGIMKATVFIQIPTDAYETEKNYQPVTPLMNRTDSMLIQDG